MEKPRSDALVLFGASGDLAYKKIFPALQAMARRGKLDFLVVGVARSPMSTEQFIEARAGERTWRRRDPAAFPARGATRYVTGAYDDPNTCARLGSSSPAVATPPTISRSPELVFHGGGTTRAVRCTAGARVIVENRLAGFGSARELNRVL
jgi:glucose-6-phosphate 1-dehydrogenase